MYGLFPLLLAATVPLNAGLKPWLIDTWAFIHGGKAGASGRSAGEVVALGLLVTSQFSVPSYQAQYPHSLVSATRNVLLVPSLIELIVEPVVAESNNAPFSRGAFLGVLDVIEGGFPRWPYSWSARGYPESRPEGWRWSYPLEPS